MSDVLLILGLTVLAVAGFLISIIAGLIIIGVGLILVSLSFSDGNGVSWRS